MARESLEGRLFDAYPERGGMRVWVLTEEGCRSFLDPWLVPFCVSGSKSELSRARPLLRGLSGHVSCQWTRKQELFSGKTLSVLEIRVPPRLRDKLARRLKDLGLSLFNADVHLVQNYHYDRGHFPLALCSFLVENGRLVSWRLRDDPWSLDCGLPRLKSVHLALTGSEVAGPIDPNHVPRGRLALTREGLTYELEGTVREQLETLAGRLKEWDPDLITTDWGDSHLLPRLDELSLKEGISLPFSRDPARGMAGRGQRSFYTYGRTVYQGGARYLFGRWHLDMKNSFLLRETGLEGLLEMARLSKIPVQRAARCTIGTALSSMQMDWAWRHGVLIPMDKAQAEDFRGADHLLAADKGGLVYEPETGWHEAVAEYDFVSMYPAMMVKHNISPETVNCPCCPENRVPGIGHHLCRRRRGLVPSVLAPILKKRARAKARAKAGGPGAEAYKRIASAHKWTLVCCFGYLGFKNARYGKIEAHECVTAWGREVLLRAKEAAEGLGLRVLHALVDCLWVTYPPGADLEALRLAIERAADCPLALEGVYKWLRFCPSKEDPLSGVPARYFGAFADGTLKVRGLALRRRDASRLLKQMQERLLERLSREPDVKSCRKIIAELLDIVEEFREKLRSGQVSPEDLAIAFQLSKSPQDYVHDTVSSIAAKKLAARGVLLHPGETVRYVIAAAKDKVKDWRATPLAMIDGPWEYDPAKYLELLERAADEILSGLRPEAPKPRPRREPRNLELPLGPDAGAPG